MINRFVCILQAGEWNDDRSQRIVRVHCRQSLYKMNSGTQSEEDSEVCLDSDVILCNLNVMLTTDVIKGSLRSLTGLGRFTYYPDRFLKLVQPAISD